MPVTINNSAPRHDPKANPPSDYQHPLPNGKWVSASQMEVMGRLHFDNQLIGNYFGVTAGTIRNIRRIPALEEAYRRGMSETALAHRQKALSMALAGDTRMLIATQHTFGQMDRIGADDRTENGTTRYSFDSAVLERTEAILKKLTGIGEAG